MQYGSVEARQLFPRLLQLIDTHPEIRDNFMKKSQFVPNWMFLQWLSQLVSVLDKPEGEAVLNILISVATDYPQVRKVAHLIRMDDTTESMQAPLYLSL